MPTNNKPDAVPMKETNNYNQGKSGVKARTLNQRSRPNSLNSGGINRATKGKSQK